jgi:hypothetical protein
VKIIEVIVTPSGETRVETKGFSGASCRDATRALEQALGSQTDEQLTREYFQFTQQSLRQRQ